MRQMLTLGFCLLLLFGSAHAIAPTVTAVNPLQNSGSNLPDIELIVDFDVAVDPISVTASTFQVFGVWSGPAPGSIALENANTRVRFTPDDPFFYGEVVMAMLSRGVKSATGDSLSPGFTWQFAIDTKPGTMDLLQTGQFSVRTIQSVHIQSYGAYAGDLNDDGWSDLSIPNEIAVDVRIFHNDSGAFQYIETIPLTGGANPSPSMGADFNGDGFIDLAVGNAANNVLSVLMGDGAGSFGSQTAYFGGTGVRGVAVADVDGDGDADIVTANRASSNMNLYYNDGIGQFDSMITFDGSGVGETSCALADANNDGVLDLFIGAISSNELILMLGDGEGGFVLSDSIAVPAGPWMIGAADLNGDGFADVACANSNANRFSVAFSDGAGGLVNEADYPTGGFPIAIDLGDIDGDGDVDAVTSEFAGVSFTIWENDGTGAFSNPIVKPATGAGSCAILHDRDNDGDMDMVGIDEIDDIVFVYTNGCCDLAGDANNNAVVNIGDVTFLIARIFGGGPAPPCPAEGDANGNGLVNIGDVTYLIARIFSAGPAPICGP